MSDQSPKELSQSERPKLKVTVGQVQFDATGAPSDDVSDLRDEFEEVWQFIVEKNNQAAGSSEDENPDVSDLVPSGNSGRGVQ